MSRNERVQILGVNFDPLTMEELISEVDIALARKRRMVLSFANPEFVLTANENEGLRDYLEHCCTWNLADGAGIVLAALMVGRPLPERVTGTDFVPRLAALAAARRYRMFFLGGAPGVAEQAALELRTLVGGALSIECHDGFFGHEENEAILDRINTFEPDALMVCMGNPKQELWIKENLANIGATLIFGNGGALDFWSGHVRRAPHLMQRWGLEWMFRFWEDRTWRRFRRILRLPRFVVSVGITAAAMRLRNGLPGTRELR